MIIWHFARPTSRRRTGVDEPDGEAGKTAHAYQSCAGSLLTHKFESSCSCFTLFLCEALFLLLSLFNLLI